MIIMCHDKDYGRSASLHPSSITNKEKGVPYEQTIKRSSSLKGQQMCHGIINLTTIRERQCES